MECQNLCSFSFNWHLILEKIISLNKIEDRVFQNGVPRGGVIVFEVIRDVGVFVKGLLEFLRSGSRVDTNGNFSVGVVGI